MAWRDRYGDEDRFDRSAFWILTAAGAVWAAAIAAVVWAASRWW